MFVNKGGKRSVFWICQRHGVNENKWRVGGRINILMCSEASGGDRIKSCG